MRMQEQGLGAAVVKVVGVLLLISLGCTRTLEHPSSRAQAKAHATTVEQVATTAEAVPIAAETVPPLAPVEAVAAAPIEIPAEPQLRVHEIRLVEREARTAVVVRFSRPIDGVTHFALSSPNRVVVDIAGPLPSTITNHTYAVSGHGVARVRVGAHEGKLRLVTDVEGRTPGYEVTGDGREVRVLLGESRGPVDEVVYLAPGIAPAVEAPVAVAAAAPPTEVAAPAPAAPAAVEPPAPVAAAAPEIAPPTQLSAEPELAPEPMHEPQPVAAAAMIGEDESAVLAANSSRGGSRGGKAKHRTAVASFPGGTLEAPGQPHEYTGQRISLDFKDADIQNVLRILADVSGLNIITTDDVQGKITMRLVEVPWDQALDSILKARGLDMVRDGNIIRVSTVEKLKDEREALRAANEAQAQAEPLRVRYIKVNYAKADEKFVKKISEILTDRGTATWDERTNTIVIRDIDKGVADAEELISHFDTQTPQILIEASIVEANENFVRDLGIQWGYSYKASPETGNATGNNFPGRIGANGGGVGAGIGAVGGPFGAGGAPGVVPFIADFPAAIGGPLGGSAFDVLLGSLDGSKSLAARLTALEREGKGKVISRPRVVTLNNQAAKIESLEILRVKLPSTGTVISTGAGGVAGSSQAATEQIKTGITLTVTPQISSDGFVFLDVFAKSSTLVPITNSGTQSPDGIPNEQSREAESHVLIKDGETFVLGGVFRNVLDNGERGIPYLRAIPVLGWAFKNTTSVDNRQELLVFITPRSVRARGSEDMASLPSAEDLWQDRNNP